MIKYEDIGKANDLKNALGILNKDLGIKEFFVEDAIIKIEKELESIGVDLSDRENE